MTEKLETFIDEHLQEFDTIELPQDLWSKIDAHIDVRSVSAVKSKLLSKLVYFGLSAIVVAGIIYFVSQGQNEISSTTSERPKEVLEDSTAFTNERKENSGKRNFKPDQPLQKNNLVNSPEKQNITEPDSNLSKNPVSSQHDSLNVPVKAEEKLLDILGVERGIFYHISYSGGPRSGRKSQVLFWYTHKELPNTHFIVEHYCWNKWIKRGKIIGKGRPGMGEYSGKIPGKYVYNFKIPPHSGENRWRVLLMNDSNVCLGVSKELRGISSKGEPLSLIEKVDYSIKKRAKEIRFSDKTYFQLYDPSGTLLKEGRAGIISYATLAPGVYTLNYDNSSVTIKLK